MKPDFYGVSIAELAAIARVDRSTASRWKAGLARVPHAVVALVRLRIFGELELVLGAAWSGWRLTREGALQAPGWRAPFTAGEVLAMPFLYGQIAALRSELDRAARARRIDFHHAGRRCGRRRRIITA
jgi:hypothetical protein